MWSHLGGLQVTRPARIASDLLAAGADPAEVGQVIEGALRAPFEYRWVFAKLLHPTPPASVSSAVMGWRRCIGSWTWEKGP